MSTRCRRLETSPAFRLRSRCHWTKARTSFCNCVVNFEDGSEVGSLWAYGAAAACHLSYFFAVRLVQQTSWNLTRRNNSDNASVVFFIRRFLVRTASWCKPIEFVCDKWYWQQIATEGRYECEGHLEPMMVEIHRRLYPITTLLSFF